MYWGFSVGGKMGRKKRTDTKGVVYLISFPNGKYYVGITTTSFEERKRSHISHRNTSNLAVHQALKTFFGQETWKVIAKGDSWEELTKLEVELIERIYDLWEQKACHKCGNDVKKRYEDTPPINTKNKKKFKHKD